MSNKLNIGTLGCSMHEDVFSGTNREGFNIQKIFLNGNINNDISKRYPDALIVDSAEEIISDPAITLIFVSPAHFEWANQAIGLGKSVRIAE